MNTLEFTFKNNIDFANLETGSPDKVGMVELRAPTSKDSKAYFRLRGLVSECVVKMAEHSKGRSEPAEASGEVTARDVMMMLSVGAGENLDALVGNFAVLAKRVGRLNDQTPFVDSHIDQIEPDEMLNMMAEYVAFFIMPSLLSEAPKS